MIVPAVTLAAILAMGTPGRAADSLNTAKQLYASAAYDDALAMLVRLSSSATPSDNPEQIDEYEALCLYALGRTADAENAAGDLIKHDPFFESGGDDASPRVQAMFTEVRKRLLPQIAKDRYVAAKAEIDAKKYAAAETHLTDVRKIVDEAKRLGVSDDALDDLGTLADGFRDLASTKAKVAAAAAAAVDRAAAPPAPRNPPARTIYDAKDADVSPPVPITQAIPPVPRELIFGLTDRKGVLALTVAADGHVEGATMSQPFKSPYDQMVLSAAKTWRYKPAVKNGSPVRYAMAIELSYKPPE